MKKSLFQSKGRFYKANLHTHSSVSDGALTPEEVKEAYKSYGYDIVAYSDHEVLVPHDDLRDDSFLPLTAIECEFSEVFRAFRDPVTGEEIKAPDYIRKRKVYHFVYIAPRPDETYYPWPTKSYVWGNAKNFIQDYYVGEKSRAFTFSNVNAAIRDAKEHGFLVAYCHPFWSQNRYEDYSGLENLDFVETYNSACETDGYVLDKSERPFDDILSLGKRVFPACSDDAHRPAHIGRGATYVKADSLSYEDVFRSLKAGDVFASTGPVFKDITFDPETKILSVESSPGGLIALTMNIRYAQKQGDLREGEVTNADFDLSAVIENVCKYGVPEDVFARITLIGKDGNRAYSRGFFISELAAL